MNTPADPSDKDALIATVLERIEVLVAQLAALMSENMRPSARVADLEARLGLPLKTPDSSSLPPSKGHKPSLSSVPKRKAKPHLGAHRLLHLGTPTARAAEMALASFVVA